MTFGVGGGGLLGTASALVLGGAMVLGGVTLGMGLMAGRGPLDLKSPWPWPLYLVDTLVVSVTSACCDQADHRPQKPAQCTSKTKEFTGLV